MFRGYIYCVFLSLIFSYSSTAQVQHPREFMPHKFGEEFTPHHRLVDYFYHVGQQSPRVQIFEYGRTNQKRPLLYAIVTSPENHANLDAIRMNNLISAGLTEGETKSELKKSIVWLSFGVHGNEAGASESSMTTIYALASGDDKEVEAWLDKTIVIIDPCINPDGSNRYTNWIINTTGNFKNPSVLDNEHREPWPSGRVNHYYHDLNRDWAWATQIETQHRLELYHKWLPHVHADFHEMYPPSPYFFAPAAEPFHTYISDWQRELQLNIGKNHASHFDKNKWLYYTREQFDLFYPAYGDTYPTFNGAVGMTYEQAGHAVSGRSYLLENGDTLTLQDRIDHHTTTALSTVEISALKYKEITEEFKSYFEDAIQAPTGKYKNYIIQNNGSTDIEDFLKLLDRHHIFYGQLSAAGKVSGYCFPEFSNTSFSYKGGDIIVPVKQPHGTMVQVLLEPKSKLVDSITYDITAWSLLAAYGLEAVATERELEYENYKLPQKRSSQVAPAYAYAIRYQGWSSARLIAELQSNGIKLRVANKRFTNSGHSCDRGTFVITETDNKRKDLIQYLNKLTAKYNCEILALKTGFSERGPDIGSDDIALVQNPSILIVGGKGTSQYNFGQIWQFMDEDLKLPYTMVLEEHLSRLDLKEFETIIFPEGYYPNVKENTLTKLVKWVNNGGKLIAFGTSISVISRENGFSISLTKESEKPKTSREEDNDKLERYEAALRNGVSNKIPGAIVRLQIDDSHPMGYGIGPYYASLKTSSYVIPHQENTWNVGFIAEDLLYTGFIGKRIEDKLKNSNSFFVKDQGQGHVIGLIDNPLYRSFWHKGKQVLFNAIFMVQ